MTFNMFALTSCCNTTSEKVTCHKRVKADLNSPQKVKEKETISEPLRVGRYKII